jgi:hypothetical protein
MPAEATFRPAVGTGVLFRGQRGRAGSEDVNRGRPLCNETLQCGRWLSELWRNLLSSAA